MKTSPIDFVLSGLFITALLAAALAFVGLVASPLTRMGLGPYHVIADFLLLLLAYGVLSAVAVRALLRFKPMVAGQYSMDDPVFTYWKLLTVLYRMGQWVLSVVTPVFAKPLLEILFGAKVGASVALGGTIDDPYLVTIGDGVVLGNASLVTANVITDGSIKIAPVNIGAKATVGANAIVMPGCVIGDGSVLMSGAVLMAGTHVPSGETWRGNPARKWT